MQNINEACCILRLKDRLISIHKGKNGVVSRRDFDGDKWEFSEEIAQGIEGGISVNISQDESIFLFCQKDGGDVALYILSGDKWEEKALQRGSLGAVYNLKIHSVVREGQIYMLYNIPQKIIGETSYKLVSQETKDGNWTPCVTVAGNVSDGFPVFTAHCISDRHYAVYYHSFDKVNVFGYREAYLPDKWSEFIPLHSSIHAFHDKSIVTTEDGIHIAFIVRSMYSCQLVYKNKFGAETSSPILLFEASRIDRVALFVVEERVYVLFSAGGYGFFSVVSRDLGRSFERPVRLKTAGFDNIIKADYIATGRNSGKVAVGNLFTDASNPGNVLLFDEIYPEYYPTKTKIDKNEIYLVKRKTSSEAGENATAEVKKGPGNKEDKNDSAIEIIELRETISENLRKISILENKLEGAYKEISEKNRQIMELNAYYGKKGQEAADVAASYRETILRLRAELQKRAETDAMASATPPMPITEEGPSVVAQALSGEEKEPPEIGL